MIRRHLLVALDTALRDTPVALLVGPRQADKSTLARTLVPPDRYVTRAAHTVTADDFRGLRVLAELAGRRFHRGLVLYLGGQTVAFGPQLHAVPFTAVWEW